MPRATRRAVIASTAAGIGVLVVALAITGPIVQELALRNIASAVDFVASDLQPRYAGPVVQISPTYAVHVPSTIRMMEAERLTVTVRKALVGHSDSIGVTSDIPPEYDTADIEGPFEVQLTFSGGLDVSPPNSQPKQSFAHLTDLTEALAWNWTLNAKSAGTHKMFVRGLSVKSFLVVPEVGGNPLEDFAEPTANDQSVLPSFIRVLPDKTLEITVEALTELGLTARQAAYARAIQGAAAFLGGLLAYPFIKRWFEKQDEERSNNKRRPVGFKTQVESPSHQTGRKRMQRQGFAGAGMSEDSEAKRMPGDREEF